LISHLQRFEGVVVKRKFTDWYIVTTQNGYQVIGRVLYGTTWSDPAVRFDRGDYSTTPQIVEQNMPKWIFTTASPLLSGNCARQRGNNQPNVFLLQRNRYTLNRGN